MILHVMAVYDKKARAYCNPFFTANPDIGMRALSGAVNSPGTQMRLATAM